MDTPPYIAYPQDFDGLVTSVTATNKNGSFRSSSNYGNFVDVAAPGQTIKTTDGDTDSDYASPNGTSMSAPIVSGIAALLLSFEPQLEDRDIERIIELSAEDKGDPGWDQKFGYGRVNARQALDLVNSNQFFHWTASGGTVTQTVNNFPVWFYDLPGGAPNGYYIGKRYEVQKSVTFPQSFTSTPVVWGRINGTVGYKW